MARQLLRYGGYLSAADLVNLGLLNVDYIIVGHVLGPVALGYYSLAYRICFMPYLSIAVVANGAVFPYYCRLPSREAKAGPRRTPSASITALSVPWFAGLVLFAGDIALLGGRSGPRRREPCGILAVYGFFLSIDPQALQVIKATGRSDLVLLGRVLASGGPDRGHRRHGAGRHHRRGHGSGIGRGRNSGRHLSVDGPLRLTASRRAGPVAGPTADGCAGMVP